MRVLGFFILSFFLLECQSLSLSMNRDAIQGHCTTVVEPPTSESPESCEAPTKENHEIAVVTVEDPSSSFFVHFRGDKKKDSVKNFCGKPILTKKATNLDSEGIPLKKVIIKRQSPNAIQSSRATQEDNQYQKQYEASVSGGNSDLENMDNDNDNDNVINSEEDAALALHGTGNELERTTDNIANPDYAIRALSGVSTDQYGEEL